MQYAVVVIAIIGVSSAIVGYVLHKMKILNFHTLVATSAASLVVSLIFPLMLNFFSTLPSIKIFMAFFISFILYTMMILVFTVLISFFISERKVNITLGTLKGRIPFVLDGDMIEKLSVQKERMAAHAKSLASKVSDRITAFEKFVDSRRNIDKIGVETTGGSVDTNCNEIISAVNEPVPQDQTEIIIETTAEEAAPCEELPAEEAVDQGLAFEEEISEVLPIAEDADQVLREEIMETSEIAEGQELTDVQQEIPGWTEVEHEDETGGDVDREVLDQEVLEQIEIETLEEHETADVEEPEIAMAYEELLYDEETIEVIEEELTEDIENTLDEELFDVQSDIAGELESDPVEFEEVTIAEKTDGDGTEDLGYNDSNDDISEYERYLEEAFRLKDRGDFEGAAMRYMDVLDANPPDDLVFGVVLEVCALYKNLGQQELAREILSCYADIFGNIMSDSVKAEIERNL